LQQYLCIHYEAVLLVKLDQLSTIKRTS